MTALKKGVAAWLSAVFAIACAFALMSGGAAFAAETNVDLGEPVHTKTLVANGDGTYNLTLDVTGKSQAASEKTKANVIVVFDVSGSMDNDTYEYVASTTTYGTKYGLVDGEYVQLTKSSNKYYYYPSSGNRVEYTGQLYTRQTSDKNRLEVAQDAVEGLTDELMAQNTTEDPDTVQMALVTFSNGASVKQSWTTNATTFKNAVSGLNANGGTNWEAALQAANGIKGDGDPTYVIFVSDGNPTFRVTQNGYNDYNNSYGAYGSGQEEDENVKRCYETAVDDAKAIVDAGKSFYAIGAFGDVSRMQGLVKAAYNNDDAAAAGKYFSASDGDALNAAFAAIIKDIQKSFTYTDIAITDKVTDLTATTAGIDGEVTDFVYKKNGEVWEDAPEAAFANGTVTWNLGDFKLEDGVTCSVSFRVWPSQEAFDAVAALTNGTADIKDYPNVVKTDDGYSIYTNESATLTYTQVNTVDGEETKGDPKTAQYERPLMPVPVSTLNIVKTWENAPAGFNKPAIEVVVTQDGQDYQTVVLDAANDWSKELAVSAGPKGHEYALTEITELGKGWTTAYGDSVEMQGFVALSSGFALGLTNTYKAAPVTLPGENCINVQKILVGRDWKDTDEFSFELEAVTEGAPLPKDVTVDVDKNNQTASFGEITFDKAGTYEYKVVETQGSIPGVSYDQTIRTVKVIVTDNGEGQLEATVDYGDPEAKAAVFTNIYGAKAVNWALQAVKVLEGRDWVSSDEFKFVLADANDTAVTNGSEVVVKDDKVVSFDETTFDKAGEYQFVITEAKGSIPGISYSDDQYVVLVSVVDDTEGQLKVMNVAYKNSDGNVISVASFTNTYKAEPAKAVLEASKQIDGRDWSKDDSFQVVLSPVTKGAPMPDQAVVELTKDNNAAAFGEIAFTQAGVYEYTITEKAGNAGGMTYDTTVHNVTVTVTDDGKGKLTAEVEYDDAEGAVFTNVYEAADTSAVLNVQKVLQGREWMEGDSFDFSIKAKTDNTPLPADKKVTVVDGKVASFGEIVFEEAGTYVYEISEDKGLLGGILYDEQVYEVIVKVSDDLKGQLHASVSYGAEDAEAAVFTNVYGAEEVVLQGETALKASKKLVGRDWAEGDKFEFVLAAVTEGAPMPEDATVDVTADGEVSFGSIAFDEVGTYEYVITETPGEIAGVSYDDAEFSVIVEVEDDKQGNLVATVSYQQDGQAVNGAFFTNVYTAQPDALKGEAALKAVKVLEGRDWIAGDSFEFKLTPKDGAPMPEDDTVFANSADAVSFGEIVFDKAGTYEYTITEVPGQIGGVTYDDTVYNVTVEVTDNGKGQLVAEASCGSAEAVVFTNSYEAADTTAVLNVQKVLQGRDWKDTDSFEFVLMDAEGIQLDTVTATNGNPVSFEELTFTEAGTYTYTVVETQGSIGGVDYDDAERTVTVKVTDNKQGKLVATVNYGAPELTAAVFTNVYGAEKVTLKGDASLKATKVFEGREWTSADEFAFVLTPKDNAPEAQKSQVVADQDHQTVSFGDITFTEAGTYEYTIAEVEGEIEGVAYDQAVYNVIVSVVDDTEGSLVATVSYKADGGVVESATFRNVYSADSVTVAPQAKKVFEGRDWNGDSFEFQLTAKNNAPMPKDDVVAATEDNKVVSFGDITFTKAGTYEYTIAEVKGDLGGVTYDETVYPVTIEVTDNGKGQLVAEVSYGDAEAAVFTNVYEAADTSAVLNVQKVLQGRDWMEGDSFDFSIKAKTDGAPLPADKTITATNGNVISFDEIVFEEAGTYVYEISEDKGLLGGILYDEQTHEVTVKVTDDGEGQLHASVSYGADGLEAAVFTNVYGAEKVVLEGETALKASKKLTGRDWAEGDKFEFVLAAVTEGAPMPEDATVDVTAQGEVSFGRMVFTEVGTYEYVITETPGEIGGIAYDDAEFSVTVEVEDDKQGNLVATVSYAKDGQAVDAAVFTNVYAPAGDAKVATADFGLTKKLTGREWAEGESFEFQIEALTEGAPMPENATATVSENGGVVDFGAITYNASELTDLPATFEYKISEVAGNAGGVSYDDHAVTVKVVVADQLDGTIRAAATVVGDKTFNNVYDVTPAELPFMIQKTLDGHDMAEGQFEFTVEPADDASAQKLAAATVKNNAAADGSTDVMVLGNLNFTLADAGKTFTYEVAEVQADAAGYTYDADKHRVEFVVADTGKGALDVTILVDGEETQAATVAFTNSYHAFGVLGAQGNVSIVANKTLEGQRMSEGEFSFFVKDAQGTQVATGTNAADGSIAFSDIEYTTESVKADVEAGLAVKNADGTYTYTYQVVENTEGLAEQGITPTVSSFGIAVTLTDDGKGSLIPEVTYPDGAGSLEFVNQYGTNEAQLVIAGAKVLSAAEGLNPPDITGKFTFTLTGQNADGLTAVNDAAGNVTFDAVTYTTADLEGVEADENNVRTAVFEYTVTESGVVDGVINDGSKSFTVTLTDDGKGNLTATPDGNAQFVFTNIYAVVPEEAPVTPQFNFLKTLEGRDMVEGEFEFQMTDAQGNVVSTGFNLADGTVVMTPMTFDKPGVYVYNISEVAGDKGGVTYDSTVFTMTATVKDNGNGTLSHMWSVDNEQGVVFKNSYEAADTAIQFGALKLLEGRDLAEGEFEFELVNNGEVMSTATNAADGSVEFEPVAFQEVGTYAFQILEVEGNASGVTYDDTVYEVEVVVTDDLNGNLVPEVTFVNGEPVFTNTYEEPKLPFFDNDDEESDDAESGEPGFAQTNDGTPFGFVAVLAGIAAAALAALRKRLA